LLLATVQSRMRKRTLPGDTSVRTYTGHRVLNTLIRARFSPMHSTGNKYIYAGCSTGKVISKLRCIASLCVCGS